MNAKQTVPLIATLAPIIGPLVPPLLVVGGLFLVAKWLFSDEESEKKTDTSPPSGIPWNSPEISVIPPVSTPATPKTTAPLTERNWFDSVIRRPRRKRN